ncbi:CCA tRNA nucleotidyltransferase [hydrothermal vent metagenome]|uniref:CCA tRNA nucleotidyltransferase n=1 Tax=hydrothermal vent metagenome TaxID=652676 RepID=A0A3B0ZCY7_9ZZZZ
MVGGAVRDKLLGLPIKDRDWVVVGATPEEMLAQGYTQVGQDFPVFLHPETKEEYALARTERKTATGYTGFEVHASPDVTLEEDLKRRDLTINAMALTLDGHLVDPLNGVRDLQQLLLRHVSPAFIEDPVRVLRVARFATRLVPLGFTIADETQVLLKEIVAADEVDALVPERVWAEIERALNEPHPSIFFTTLRECGALARILPEVDALFGVPQPEHYHPEIDSGIHTMMVLDSAATLTADPEVRFAALCHDLGKGNTPRDKWPSHHGHEERGVKLIQTLCKRMRIPKRFQALAILVARYHTHCHRAAELRSTTLLKTLESLDAFRRPARLEQFLTACKADARGRTGYEACDYPQEALFSLAYRVANAVDIRAIVEQGQNGKALANEIHAARARAIKIAIQ